LRVADAGQEQGARLGVQLGVEQTVGPAIAVQLADPALLVGQVAEDDRLGRARRLTGGDDVTIGQRPPVDLRPDLAVLDALHAEGALLHHAAVADGDLGVEHQLAHLVARSAASSLW
jgi:hypothetical protein